jgi:hypothetical protein
MSQYVVISADSANKNVSATSLEGCPGTKAMSGSLSAVKNCIDISPTFKGKEFSLPASACPQPAAFCAADATTDVFACQKRLSATDLPESAWKGLLSTYPCAAVHRGIPIVKAGKVFAPLYWDTVAGAVLSMPLSGCTEAIGDKASSVEIAKSCLNKIDKNVLKKNGLFIDAPGCPA